MYAVQYVYGISPALLPHSTDPTTLSNEALQKQFSPSLPPEILFVLSPPDVEQLLPRILADLVVRAFPFQDPESLGRIPVQGVDGPAQRRSQPQRNGRCLVQFLAELIKDLVLVESVARASSSSAHDVCEG